MFFIAVYTLLYLQTTESGTIGQDITIMTVRYKYHSAEFSFEIDSKDDLVSLLLNQKYVFSDADRYIILGSEPIDSMLKERCVEDLYANLNETGHHPSMIWVENNEKIIYFVREYFAEYEKQLIIKEINDSIV